ncbi:MAG: hypothetical protein JWN00_1746 [Actinomycetia bacterium]|nr:hypothetical protein [Actinomycetes bacterium]
MAQEGNAVHELDEATAEPADLQTDGVIALAWALSVP